MNPVQPPVEQAHRTATLIHIALMGAVVIYGIISFVLAREAQGPVTANLSILRPLFWFIATGEFFFALTFKGFLTDLLNRPSDQISGPVNVPKRLTAHIITCAMLEVPAVLGLALSILSHNFHDYYFLGFL